MKKTITTEILGAVVLIAALFSYIAAMCGKAIGGSGLVLMVVSIFGYGIISGIQTMENASAKLQKTMAFVKIGFVVLLLALSPLIDKIAGGV